MPRERMCEHLNPSWCTYAWLPVVDLLRGSEADGMTTALQQQGVTSTMDKPKSGLGATGDGRVNFGEPLGME
jgi:hypothetical protein